MLTGEGAPDAFVAGPIIGFWYDPEGEYVQCPPRHDPYGSPHTSWGQAQMTFRGDHAFMLVGMTLDLGDCMGPMDNSSTGTLVKINR